ncbi:unnamed protein product [Parnassius mnemosyne]|uniref:RNA-directed DNA polymerase n=1 Tax=Parnassius mnemosyne TaxID=213953 RepID=A0AAV1L287_9NEOP
MSIGKISEFKVATDNWKLYVERLEQFFVVNKISSELHVPTLITVMGAESYELLVSLCTPEKPTSKTFLELTKILENYLQPKPSELAERFKFRQRKQRDGESISEYVTDLKKMSKTCEFGSLLQESLRDQFVCGISSETIRQRLFAESKLDFGKAYQLAVSMEAAEKDAASVDVHPKISGDSSASTNCYAMVSTRRTGRAIGCDGERRAGSKGEVRMRGRASRIAAATPTGPRVSTSVLDDRRRHQRECRACGNAHDVVTCKFARYVCRVCNKQGHLQRMCPYLAGQHSLNVVQSETDSLLNSEESDEVMVCINQLSVSHYKPLFISLTVHGRDVQMECDTGSAVSCISYELYKQQFSNLKLNMCPLLLRYYTGEQVKPVGVIRPLVKYKDKEKHLDLYVIQNGKSILLGRQWLAELNIQLPPFGSLNCLSNDVFNLNDFSSRYCKVFADGLRRFTGPPVSIRVREGAQPVFMRARPLAYALRAPVERALEQLVADGILTPVDRSDWATPIVPVVKKDGKIRICADYKLTLNKVIEVDRYPLPRVEDLLVRLQGGQRFSKIDLSQAYAQFVLDESAKYTVINTHKGLFRYNRLVYGLSSSPGIFQKHLEQLFNLPYVGVFLDDIIITGRNTEEHISNLHKVFDRLQSYGLRVKKEKCVFFAESVYYLGYVISKDGIHTCPDKIKAIVDTPVPTNVSELRAYIGMIMYYAKFVKNISTILAPLYNLLRTGIKFDWCDDCQRAFKKVKELLSSSKILMHYSSDLPIVLTCDASSVGVGAVISHLTPEGERPVAYASRSLTAAERAYSQIDREALAIVFGVRKYHQYLYGRKFILRTDHKPLTHIFGKKTGIPVMAASRIQRWAVLLSGYDYNIEYVTSNKNCADGLSRLPISSNNKKTINREITYINFVENFLPVTNEDVTKATSKDIILSRIFAYIKSGWPTVCPGEEVKPYFVRRNELYLDNGSIMWGYRMVIPSYLRPIILKQLHSSHMGIVKTKGLARSYVWWPNIDADVEALCRSCETCASEADAPPRAPPNPWPYLPPWPRVHIDFLGPYKGKTYLVLIDSSSKWLEIIEVARTNATSIVKVLRSIFARFGLPLELVSDQGPPFTSIEFKSFLKNNGIQQRFSPAYHPASNGAAENAVKLCKRAIKKAYRDDVDIDTALQTFLLSYRNSKQSTTGESPAMLLQ